MSSERNLETRGANVQLTPVRHYRTLLTWRFEASATGG